MHTHEHYRDQREYDGDHRGCEDGRSQMVFHLVYVDDCEGSKKFTAVIVVEGRMVHMAIQCAQCKVSRTTEGSASSLNGHADYIAKIFHGHVAFEASLLSWLPILSITTEPMGAALDEKGEESIENTRNEPKRRKQKKDVEERENWGLTGKPREILRNC